ncbi:primase [Acinetobacter phage XC1]|nr:primase [Acinetobacter phage XC1]
MNIDEIKRNAPEGATHYREYTGQYLKKIGTYWYLWRLNRWDSVPFPYLVNLKALD